MRMPWLALALGCHAPPSEPHPPPPPPPSQVVRTLPIQIKQAHDLHVRGARFALLHERFGV
jgi:hypothetical protein